MLASPVSARVNPIIVVWVHIRDFMNHAAAFASCV
jgi:hypothetical protein